MVGENFGIHWSQLAKNILKFSTVVGENFGILSSQLAKNILKLINYLETVWTKVWNKNVLGGNFFRN